MGGEPAHVAYARTQDEAGPQPLSEDIRRFGGQVSQGGAGHTAWSSPFILDSSPLLPGLGETPLIPAAPFSTLPYDPNGPSP